MAATTIFYHADCLDGFGAAYAAWAHFGDNACYRAMHHGEPFEISEIAGHDVYILDFSFPPQQLQKMAQLAKSVTQLDHHASALQACAGWLASDPKAPIDFHHPELPLHLHFDLAKSGACISWEYFHPNTALPLPLAHIQDQDLWRFQLDGTREFCRALRLLPFEFESWDNLVRGCSDSQTATYLEMRNQGAAVEIFFRNEVERLSGSHLVSKARLRGEPIDALQALRHGQEVISHGDQNWQAISGLGINASALFASDVGNSLAEQSGSFGMVWQLAGDGEAKVSLRSQGHFDVAAIATRYGGGGHRNAAGFRLPLDQFAREVLGVSPDQVST